MTIHFKNVSVGVARYLETFAIDYLHFIADLAILFNLVVGLFGVNE